MKEERKRISKIKLTAGFKMIPASLKRFLRELIQCYGALIKYTLRHLKLSFFRFEFIKGLFVTVLYRQRGKYSKRFMHTGMAGLAAMGIMIAPVIANEFPGTDVDPWDVTTPSMVLSATTQEPITETLISEKMRDRVINYVVQEGDTVGSIAEKFDVSQDTVLWQNDLTESSKIKPGSTLEILPITGVTHKVTKGETVYSIAKKYDSSAQAIVDFPYNTFMNDETFELAIGQIVVVPDGIMPQKKQASPRIRRATPDAGTVVASGQFVWPAGGRLTQYFSWYHKGVDIANRDAPSIVAADAGTVVQSGWPNGWGYGNRVVVDHGNGYKTLYAHFSSLYVVAGQTVSRGDALGKMGCTGRCTGTHLHFEVIKNGVYINPLSVLQ